MDHAWNLTFVFGFYGYAIAAVSHGNNSILKIVSGAAVYKGTELCVYFVIGGFHGTSNLSEPRTCIIGNLFL